MPALQNKSYFNYGGQGPLPQESLNAITASWRKIQTLGPFTNKVWPYIASEVDTTRKLLAGLCGVPPTRLALTENVTSGCVLPLWGLLFSPGERILISDCEHPGVVAACKELARREQLEIDILRLEQLKEGSCNQIETDSAVINELNQCLKQKTRLVVLSHLFWNTGQRMPICKVAQHLKEHPKQPYLLVDGAQSFGQIPIQDEAKAADIYAFTGHKWACGPEGLGGVAVSERVLSESSPTLVGWRSLKNENTTNFNAMNSFHLDSRRFEVATSCVPLLAGLRCSLKLFEATGTSAQRLEKIQSWSAQLWDLLRGIEGVEPLLKGHPPAGLVTFSLSNGMPTREIVKKLGGKGLWIRDIESPVSLRACLHIISESEEINSLAKAIKEIT